jgi:hypothetical protein
MKLFRGASLICLGTAVLAGCGAQSQSPSAAGAMLPATTRSHAPDRLRSGQSWMNRKDSSGALLYVSDYGANKVYVYTYPGGSLAGTLAVASPRGECVNAAGDVYVTAGDILEFKHGGTRPINKLHDELQAFDACSVDRATGDLAATELQGVRGTEGWVVVYGNARGRRRVSYGAPNLYSYYFLGYDNHGNLFVDGSRGKAGVNVAFEYAMLARHHVRMKPINLTGGSIAFPGNVQWDGAHIAIGDQNNAVIYQTSGSTIVGSTPLGGSSDVVGFFIDGSTVICSDAGNGSVEFYNYPAGGTPFQTLTGFQKPIGAVVSP